MTDDQWAVLDPLLPEPERRADGRGRPWADKRKVLEGILWVLRTGARWKDLPDRYPPKSTCFDRFQQWVKTGVLDRMLQALYELLQEAGEIALEEAFIDGTFVPARRGGDGIGKTKRGKGTKIMAIVEGNGLPIALHVESASPHEVTLVQDTLDATFGFDLPEYLIGDKGYDSDKLDRQLVEQGVEMIAPNRANRKKTQDGRKLRRYKRRYRVERAFAWLYNYRRLNTRWERKLSHFLGMVQLAALLILLRHCPTR